MGWPGYKRAIERQLPRKATISEVRDGANVSLICGCGEHANIHLARHFPPDKIIHQLRKSGWILRGNKLPICPACQGSIAEPEPVQPEPVREETMPKGPYKKSPSDEEVLEFVKSFPGSSAAEIVNFLDSPKSTVLKKLTDMRNSGKLDLIVKPAPQGGYIHEYYIPGTKPTEPEKKEELAMKPIGSKPKITLLPTVKEPVRIINREPGVQSTAAARLSRRKAWGLLDDNFSVETGNYKSGWTDQRIATESNLSPNAVAEIRERDFGPIRPPREDLSKLTEELKTLRQRGEEMFAEHKIELQNFNRKVYDLEVRIGKIMSDWGS